MIPSGFVKNQFMIKSRIMTADKAGRFLQIAPGLLVRRRGIRMGLFGCT
jgi:hypothetical protein